ncbi:MAG: DUF4136 domain-containing protein [Spirosomataceae bacterium]
MKKALLPLFVFILVIGGCTRQKYLVESDYSFLTEFEKYRNFTWRHFDHSKLSKVGWDSTTVGVEIAKQMQLRGYKSMGDNADLIVISTFYDDSFRFQGYYQPDLRSRKWIKEDEQKYSKTTYRFRNGTLLIQFVDNSNSYIIWQGYASGIPIGEVNDNSRVLKRAIRDIFDEYTVMATGM